MLILLSNSQKFIKNTMILTVTSLSLNVISMAFRIFISAQIGTEGLGLFTLIMSVYFFASTVASSGINLSVTRLVSESIGSKQNPAEILYKSISLAVALGSFSALLLFVCSDFVGIYWLCDPRAALPLKILAFSLPFFGISVCFGGYFMAKRRVWCIAKWQIFDQLLQIFATVVFLSVMPKGNIQVRCCAIVAGSVFGEIAACAYGFILYDRCGEKYVPSVGKKLYKNILSISLPIAISSYFRAGLSTLENILIPKGFSKLQISKEAALSEYGILKGMAMPAISFPSALLGSLSSLLIPEISEAASVNDKKKVARLSFIAVQGCIIYSILILAVFFTFGNSLGIALFDNPRSGHIMKIISWAIPFIYMDSVFDGILKATNQQVASMKYNTLEGISRIVLLYALIPVYGTVGFIIVVFVSNMLSSLLGLIKVLQVTGIKINLADCIFIPVLTAVCCAFFARAAALPFSENAILYSAIGVAVLAASFSALVFLCRKKPAHSQKASQHTDVVGTN